MKRPLLSLLRQNTKLLNSILFFTCWSQLHAHANSYYLNKKGDVAPRVLVGNTIEKKSKSVFSGENANHEGKASDTGKGKENTRSVQANLEFSPSPAYAHVANRTIKYYESDIKEGIVGVDSQHPIDQVYDNIFNITINERINSHYAYTLEYDLYGAENYQQISKVINDEVAVGGSVINKSDRWTHQSEPISKNTVNEGLNTVIFTLPYSSKDLYKVRNVRIGISNKKSISEVENSYKALSVSKRVSDLGNSEKISLSTAELAIEKNTVKNATVFSVTALRDIDMPVLSPEMVNVTSGNTGYRFLPHGEHFSAPAKVSLGYDKSKIPDGYTEQDIKTYYFDRTAKKWTALDKDSVNHKQDQLVSKTTHFTDMINGVLKVPESPETGSYAPNSIKDIKAANPSEGIVSIAPPTANSMGSVTTSFPIKVPAGRAGMQPSLSVNYNSEGGNGWMGQGWDLSTPAITIDTRWGVPRYDSGTETETYTFGGEQLTFEATNGVFAMPNRKEGFDKARQNDRQFYPRIEGSYNKIVRRGTNPTNY